MDPIAEQVASLRRETMQRHTDNVKRADERHGELVIRLERIEDKQGEDREELSAVKSIMGYLRDEWDKIRTRYHEMIREQQIAAKVKQESNGDGDTSIVRRVDLTQAIGLFTGGVLSVLGLLRLMGKL